MLAHAQLEIDERYLFACRVSVALACPRRATMPAVQLESMEMIGPPNRRRSGLFDAARKASFLPRPAAGARSLAKSVAGSLSGGEHQMRHHQTWSPR
jgi:hypothetical protein